MKRFERDRHFWEVDQRGPRVVTRFGEVGKKPREVIRELDSDALAAEALSAAIQRKRDAGFESVDAATEGGRRVADNRTLEDRVHAHPHDLEAWSVWVDWALQQGGGLERLELAALEIELARNGSEDDRARNRRERLRARVIPGAVATRALDEPGFTARFGFMDQFVGQRLPDDPDAWRFLRTFDLTLGQGGDVPPGLFRRLRERPPRSLREVRMHAAYPEYIELSWVECGPFGLFETCPHLRVVHLLGNDIALGRVAAPALQTLILETTGLAGEVLQELAAGELPRLRHLELWLGSRWRVPRGRAAPTPEDVRALLDRPLLSLKRLGLRNAEITDALVPVILASPVLPQLETLDLSLGTLTDAGAERLIAAAPRLQHLTLDLTRNGVTDAVASRVRTALPRADVTDQRHLDAYDEDDLYVAIGE